MFVPSLRRAEGTSIASNPPSPVGSHAQPPESMILQQQPGGLVHDELLS